MLLERPRRHDRPPLLTWSDPVVAGWLLLALPLAFVPYRHRWRICRLLAALALSGSRARHAVRAIGRTLGIAAADARREIAEVYAGRLAANLDVVRGLVRGPDLAIECRGLAEIDAALARGQGAVLWVSDFVGAGDAVKIGLARAGYHLTHLSRPEHGFSKSRFAITVLNPFRIRFECRYLAERVVFDRSHPSRSMVRLDSCLRLNGLVSITASAHEGKSLIEASFFDGRLRLATGALRLALATRSVVLPVFAFRTSERPEAFTVIVERPLAWPAGTAQQDAIVAGGSDYVERLERHVEQRPGAWGGWRRIDQIVRHP